ncbi:MAG TPA: hypothetical protein VFQ65_05985 [Kofleriaceae bacterium]|nr:hypothetical protein [Kofleriaceae bacterium]
MKLALAFVVVARVAVAEPIKSVGVDATLSIPLSPWIHATGYGGGGSVWLHVPVTDLVEVTARLGATVHADRPIGDIAPGARARLSEIPLLGGARYRLTDGTVRGYLEGEVGLIFRRVDVDVRGLTDNSARIRLASSLGVAVEVDRFELRAAVWLADLSDLDGEIGVIVSAGARFYRF